MNLQGYLHLLIAQNVSNTCAISYISIYIYRKNKHISEYWKPKSDLSPQYPPMLLGNLPQLSHLRPGWLAFSPVSIIMQLAQSGLCQLVFT